MAKRIFKLAVTSKSKITVKQVYAILFIGYFVVPFSLPMLANFGLLVTVLWWILLSWAVKKWIRPFVVGNIRAWQELWIRLYLLILLVALFMLGQANEFIIELGAKNDSQFYIYQYGYFTVVGLAILFVLGGGLYSFYQTSHPTIRKKQK